MKSPAAPIHRGGPTDPSHDENLRRGIIRTDVSRGLAAALVATFLLLLVGVPVGQAVLDAVRGEDSVLLDIFKRRPTKALIKQYEKDLEEASALREFVRPRLQLVLSRYGRFGNAKAVIGQGEWLYYKPGIMAVAGPGFLDKNVHAARRKAALDDGDSPPQQDPRPAVLAMHKALRDRGIALVLLPVPDKATLVPGTLHRRRDPAGGLSVATNLDYPRFVNEMRDAGVLIFDPSPPTLNVDDPPRFLEQDTHWTPAFMQDVSGRLAAFVTQNVALPRVAQPPQWTEVPTRVSRVGDIVDMLKLPADQTLFQTHTISINVVQDAGGQPWAPSEKADVLLLGDSFANIYSQEPMGWGQGAGLGPHLALCLKREIDVIAQNDSGAFATRKLLSEALGAGEDRLAGKRVVIWEFAARELATGDWKPFSMALGKAP